MKTLGIIGGMSWESTQVYYALINQGVKSALGGLHSAKILMQSLDFAEIEQLQAAGDWQASSQVLCDAALGLQSIGADAVMIATNTMHKVADDVAAALTVPLLHIADATGEALRTDQRKNVALLGTRFTMQEAFYKQRLEQVYNMQVLLPSSTQQDLIHQVIYEELCLGEFKDSSREQYCRIIDELVERGADSVALACTEIPLLVNQSHTSIPLYDTTKIHADAAISFALS